MFTALIKSVVVRDASQRAVQPIFDLVDALFGLVDVLPPGHLSFDLVQLQQDLFNFVLENMF